MTVRFTAAQVLEQIFSSVDQEDYSDSEEEKEVSENEDREEYDPEREADQASSRSSEEDPEEAPEDEGEAEREAKREDKGENEREAEREDEGENEREAEGEEEIASAVGQRETPLLSKNGKIKWSPVAYGRRRRARAICHAGPDETLGPTAYAVSHARDIVSVFRLFVTPAIERIILDMTNLHGVRKYGDGGDRDSYPQCSGQLGGGALTIHGLYSMSQFRSPSSTSSEDRWGAISSHMVSRAQLGQRVVRDLFLER